MADKTIGELPRATSLDSESLLVAEQQGEAVSVTGELIASFARDAAAADVQKAVDAAASAETAADRAELAKDSITIDEEKLAHAVSSASTSASEASASASEAEEWSKKAEAIAGGGVLTFNGRSGYVLPASGDYTYDMVGAAPAGYGSEGEAMTYYSGQKQDDSEIIAILNGELTKLSNYSSSKFGMYVYPAMAIDLLMCEMVKINANTAMVKAYSYNGWKLQRMFASGAWGAWEWVNPPMNLGVEYRTTERYLNKPVYRKLVSFGTLPNATGKSVAHGCENAQHVVSHRITLTNGAEVSGWSGILNVFIDGSNITIATNGDQSAYSANVMIKYTKTTD